MTWAEHLRQLEARRAKALAAAQACWEASPGGELMEAAAWFIRHEKALQSDLMTAHRGRGDAASMAESYERIASSAYGPDPLPEFAEQGKALRALLADRERLRLAVKPFATVGRLIDRYFPKHGDAETFHSGAGWRDKEGNTKTLTLGDFRAAEAALNTQGEGE